MAKTITSLKSQKNKPNKVNVYLDGEFSFSLTKYIAAWLYVGKELDEEKIKSLLDEDLKENAYQNAVKFINYRERSSKELEIYLKKKRFDNKTIDFTLDRLQQNGLIDDHRFAKLWVENRTSVHPKSKRAIRYELRNLGIEDQEIDRVLETINENKTLKLVAVKHSKKYKGLDWQNYRKKIYPYLLTHGFAYDEIGPVIFEIWKQMEEDTQKILQE